MLLPYVAWPAAGAVVRRLYVNAGEACGKAEYEVVVPVGR